MQLESSFDVKQDEGDEENNHDEDYDHEDSLAKKLFALQSKRGSAQTEVMKSLNNIRLNMSNQHLIEGSRNIMGKVRGLSIGDLNKPSTISTDDQTLTTGVGAAGAGKKQHHYKTILLASLALLFLYLIYQNLFSDKWEEAGVFFCKTTNKLITGK